MRVLAQAWPPIDQETMIERAWLGSRDAREMLRMVRGRASARKLRLFACAVVRLLPAPADKAEAREREAAVEVAERFADGEADEAALTVALACSAGQGWFWPVAHRDAFEAAEYAAVEEELSQRQEEVVAVLRDLFGNPFRPVSFDPAWRTPLVRSLAVAAYEERPLPQGKLDEARLAILADALEESGCMTAEVLEHLRSGGVHFRGCWPLDLVLAGE